MKSIINAVNNLSMAINNLASSIKSNNFVTGIASKSTTSNPYTVNSTITKHSHYPYSYSKTKNLPSTISDAEYKALMSIYNAITDKGSHPDHHDHIMRELRTKWPTLYKALDELILARTNPKYSSIWKEKEL